MTRSSLWILGLLVAGCAPTTYAYRFELIEPHHDTIEAVDDDTVKAELQIAGDAIALELTNKTTEPLQVQWNKISLDRGDGTTTALRPAIDLGWIEAGHDASARLVPFVVPRTGTAAARYEGRRLELVIPVIARREPKTYRFHFVAHVYRTESRSLGQTAEGRLGQTL